MPGLFGLGSWNEIGPEFFQNAMARGAQLGLSERAQEREETSAADRLRLAYDQLHSQEKRAAEAAQVRLRVGLAAQQLRAQQMQNMLDFHKGELDLRGRQLALAERRESRMSSDDNDMTPSERLHLQISAHNMMAPKQNELETDPSYQSRTNFASGLLKQLGGGQPKKSKRMRFNPSTNDIEPVPDSDTTE